MDNVFYIDDLTGASYSYDQLLNDVEAVGVIPALHEFSDCYPLFVSLVAAISHNATLALLPYPLADVQKSQLLEQLTSNIVSDPTADGGNPSDTGTVTATDRMQRLLDYLPRSKASIGIMTSGSTGLPKLVWHSIDTLTRSVRSSEGHRHDVWGLAYHPAHFAGLQVFFQAICNSNRLVRLFGLAPSDVHDVIAKHQLTHLSATPTFFNLLCSSQGPAHPSVKRITTGGERLPTRLVEHIARVFPNAKLTNIYASTETGSLLVADGEYFSVPKALDGLIKIVDGELAVHRSLLAKSLYPTPLIPGPSPPRGRRERGNGIDVRSLSESKTHAPDGPDKKGGGGDFFCTGQWSHATGEGDEFYLTGDLVELAEMTTEDVTGLRFRFLSRRQDMINVGGYKVNPLEIEELLLSMDEVSSARVYGLANSVTGYLVACDLVLHPQCTLSTLQIRERLTPQVASYKIPRIVNFVDALPLTYSGKQDRLS
jgi:acyl-coenzyme A synthetase/AMP-(fatty) acid ligase